MPCFKDFGDDQELRELYMHGRIFTWSNDREMPTLTKIDCALVSVDWEIANPDYLLQALSTLVSDHAPLLLFLFARTTLKRRFRFELF